jgi:hypothetical protein
MRWGGTSTAGLPFSAFPKIADKIARFDRRSREQSDMQKRHDDGHRRSENVYA